jgi:lysophospholipase L1-like esterase
VIAGTCGSTEPVTYTAALSNDGGAQWAHLGGPQWDIASDPAAPTITNVGTGVSLQTFEAKDFLSLFTFNGCTPYYNSGTSRIELRTFQSKADGTQRGQAGSVAFWSDAPLIEFYVSASTQGITVFVDGRPLMLGAMGSNLAGSNWFDINWTYRKPRLYEFFGGKDPTTYFRNLGIDVRSQVWPYKRPVNLRGAFIGDSYLAGSAYGPFMLGNMLPQHFGRLIGIDDMWNFGIGGTGLLNTNSGGGGPFYTYRERLPQVLALNPDVIFVYGSTNDGGFTQAQVQAEALLFLDAIRASTNAPVFWFGPSSISATSTADAGVSAAVALRPNKNIFYQSMMSPTPAWISGSHNNASYRWSDNMSQYIAVDNTHPVDKGTMYFANRMATAYANDLLPLVV